MTSLRHKPSGRGDLRTAAGQPPEPPTLERALDAARESLLMLGWSRTTLTEIARRAGVSRMTLYRKWPDMSSLVGDLMTREWSGLIVAPDPGQTDQLARLVAALIATVRAIRDNELFNRIIELDPQLLLPYLLERRGRSQDLVIRALADQIREGQHAGSIRCGDPDVLARTVVLTAHGFTLSAQTMGDPVDFDAELSTLIESYLKP